MNLLSPGPIVPYPGLRHFEEKDYEIFFGREVQVIQMLRQLEDRRFLAVVGSSGCGKSSLVIAGLLPAIRRGFLQETKDWVVVPPVKPGYDPYRRLASALVRCAAPADPTGQDASKSQTSEELIAETLRETDKGLLDALAKLELTSAARIFLVVDQFEELFAFRWTKAGRDKVAPRNDAASFVRMLLRSCSDPNGRVWVVLTMRSDFIGNCEAFLGLPEAVSRGQFLVPRLDRKQMEEAIVRPGEVRTAAFQPFTFQQDLVNRIINDAGDRPDQLPMMQHALMRAWKRAAGRNVTKGKLVLTQEDYQKVGGIEEALSRHADEAWDKIKDDPKKAKIAHRLFVLLCDVSPDGQITRRRPQVKEAMAVTGASIDDVGEVMRVFQEDDRNFLLASPGQALTPDTYVDVSHEALLRCWHVFSKWLENEREAVAELRRLVDRIKGGALLQAKELDRVAQWQKDNLPSAEWAERYVTADQWNEVQTFIARSAEDVKRQREEELQRQKAEKEREKQQALLRRNVVLIILGILLLAAGVSFFFIGRAKIEAQKAKAVQDALSNGFFRTIGVSDQTIPTQDEREALWELAQLDRANAAVRDKLLDRWFETAEAFMKGEARGGQGFLATTGLSPEYHRRTISGVEELGRRLAGALENPRKTYRLSSLGNALVALAAKMEPQAAAEIAKSLAAALENPQETASDRLSILGNALAALAAKMEPQAAAEIAKGLAAALENPQETASDRLSILGNALAALAAKMEPQAAADIASRGARRLAAALENSQQTDPDSLSSLGFALAALATKVEPQAANEIAKSLAAAMKNPQGTASDLFYLGSALAALATKVEPQAANEIAKSLAVAMGNPQGTASDLFYLGSALAALATKVEPQAANEIAKSLAAAMENPQETTSARLSILGSVLAALAAKVEPQAAAEIASRGARPLAVAMENPQETASDRLSNLGNALAALAAKMEPQAAAEIAKGLVGVMENPQETASGRLSSLGNALAALAAKMEPQAAAEIAKGLAAAMENPQETASDRLSSLGNALAALAAKMEPQAAAEIASRGARPLAAAMENPQETASDRLSSLGFALAALAAKMEPQAAAEIASRGARPLAAAMENPQETASDRLSSLGFALAALAAKMEPQAAAEIASRGARPLAAAMEDPQRMASDRLSSLGFALAALAAKMEPQAAAEIAKGLATAMEHPQETASDRLSSLGFALAALAAKMEPQAVAEIAKSLAAAMEHPQETASDRLSSLGKTLAALCALLPSAHHAHLLALSNMLLQPVSTEAPEGEKQPYDRNLLVGVCAQLHKEDLAELLKYPLCTGEAEKIVLIQLQAVTGRNFGGNVWKFVEQADALGIKNFDSPAQRPLTLDAVNELAKLGKR